MKNTSYKRLSQRLSCSCERTAEVPKLVALAGCTEDNAAVAALPDIWEPRRGGPILANYLKKREQDHQTILQDLKKVTTKLNNAIDAKVRNLAENLQSHIRQNLTDMNCVVEDCNYDNDDPIAVEARNDALKSISDLYSQRVEDMAKFKREALALERERADGLREALRGHFQRLIAVGHQTPKDLLHDFDERSYEANQQLLSNSRAYLELVAQLRAHADENVIRAKSSINQLCLGVQLTFRRRSAQLSSISKMPIQKRAQSAAEYKKHRSSSASIKNILGGVTEFDECVSVLVEAYRNAVRKVFTGFSGKLTDLREDLGKGGSQKSKYDDDEQTSEIGDMIERTLRRLSSCVSGKMNSSRNLLELTFNDALNMKKSLIDLGEQLRSTYIILHNAGHLWDAHIMRSALAQKLTMSAVEDLITSNDSIELANEIQYNIALEQLRYCADAEKLQQQYEALIVMLDKTAELYLRHSEAEIGRIEEFMNLPATMANILLAEFDCFLERHPRAHPQPLPESPEPLSNTPTGKRYLSLSSSPLPRIILQSELQGLALQNWKNGFLESFESNVSLVPDELKRQARAWADEKNSSINIRYSMKMMSHGIRAERVKAARDVRLLELRHHEARLNSHLDAIRELIETLPVEASEFQALDSPALYPFCNWIDRLQENMDEVLAREPLDPEVKRLNMSSYAPRLLKHRSLFEDSLDDAIAEYKKFVEHEIQAARVSNVRFASALKLFSEGGTYAAPEAVKASAALVKAADLLEICVNKTFDCLNSRRSQLLALADQRMAPLLRASEDYSRGGKGGAKKPPPPAAKKKK